LVYFGLSGASQPHHVQLLRSQSLAVSSSATLVAERGNTDFKSNVSNDVNSNVSKDAKSNGSTDGNLNNSAGANQSKPESKPFSLNKSSEDAPEHAPDPDHMEVPPEGSYALEASGLEEQSEEHDKTPFSEEDPIALADEIAKQYPHDEPPKDQEYHEEADLAEEDSSLDLANNESSHSSLDFDVNESSDADIIKAMESEDPPDNITAEIKPSLIAQEAEDGTEDEDMMADDMSAEDLEAETPQDGPKVSEVKPPDEAAQEVAQVEEEDDPIKLAEEIAKQYPNDQAPSDIDLEDMEDHYEDH